MGPNNQIVRKSPIKMGKYTTRTQSKPFISGNGITVDLNHNETGTDFIQKGSFIEIDTKSGSNCNQRSKESKNGHHHHQSRHYKKLFTCSFCGYVTDRRNNLARHVSTMHDTCKQLLECCGIRFESKATFRYHINECHKEGYSCSVCGHNFHRKALLKRHLSIHSGRKEFACSECNYGTSHKSNLERHKKVHSKEVNHKKETVVTTTKKEESSTPPPLHRPSVLIATPRGTSPYERGLPLKKRHLRISQSPDSSQGSLYIDEKQQEEEWSNRTTDHVGEQTQPLDLQIEPRREHPSEMEINRRSLPHEPVVHLAPNSQQAFPIHTMNAVPWTLLTPAIYTYRTGSYPSPYLIPNHEVGGPHSRRRHWQGDEGKMYMEEEEVARETGRNRIMATPYKCFECNCRFSSQLSLALHLQSLHPMADVVTLSIVTVLNNMSKVKRNIDPNDDQQQHFQYQREELQQFIAEL